MKQAIRGVNLGGWLVLEPWMTPSLFEGSDALDEYTFCEQATAAQKIQLREFREKFITKEDFEWLKERSIEAVRIPVGYWLFGDVAPFEPTIDYLDRAFEWAEATGIKVLISVHGAPGSQNGEVHSGRQGPVGWHKDRANVGLTLDIVQRLAERYKGSKHLLGIGLLNEPSPQIPRHLLIQYYRRAYQIIRATCGERAWVAIGDRFKPWRWMDVLHRLFYRNAYIDSHQYQIYRPRHKAMNSSRHIRYTLGTVARRLRCMRWHHPVMVGEWSAALDAQSLVGLDADGVRAAYRAYARVQLKVFDDMEAWFYWSYRVEGGGPWSFRDCYEKDWFLQQS